jgi:hypothetical protein
LHSIEDRLHCDFDDFVSGEKTDISGRDLEYSDCIILMAKIDPKVILPTKPA